MKKVFTCLILLLLSVNVMGWETHNKLGIALPDVIKDQSYWSVHPYICNEALKAAEKEMPDFNWDYVVSYNHPNWVLNGKTRKELVLMGSIAEDYNYKISGTFRGILNIRNVSGLLSLDDDLSSGMSKLRYWFKSFKLNFIDNLSYRRTFNHFSDVKDHKLSNMMPGIFVDADAVEWAMNHEYNNMDYVTATSGADETPENWFALGHAIHLLSDMAVPAHTRNDNHAFGDPLETHIKENPEFNTRHAVPIKVNKAPLDKLMKELREYSNENYLTDDTKPQHLKADSISDDLVVMRNDKPMGHLSASGVLGILRKANLIKRKEKMDLEKSMTLMLDKLSKEERASYFNELSNNRKLYSMEKGSPCLLDLHYDLTAKAIGSVTALLHRYVEDDATFLKNGENNQSVQDVSEVKVYKDIALKPYTLKYYKEYVNDPEREAIYSECNKMYKKYQFFSGGMFALGSHKENYLKSVKKLHLSFSKFKLEKSGKLSPKLIEKFQEQQSVMMDKIIENGKQNKGLFGVNFDGEEISELNCDDLNLITTVEDSLCIYAETGDMEPFKAIYKKEVIELRDKIYAEESTNSLNLPSNAMLTINYIKLESLNSIFNAVFEEQPELAKKLESVRVANKLTEILGKSKTLFELPKTYIEPASSTKVVIPQKENTLEKQYLELIQKGDYEQAKKLLGK